MLNAYAVLAKALIMGPFAKMTACSHFNVEFVTFFDVSVIGFNERTIGHFIDKF